MDAIAFDAIANRPAHSGLEESLGARVYSDIVDLIELTGPTRRQDERHEVFGTPGWRAGESTHVHVFGLVGDFAHGRQGDFSHHLAREVPGRDRRLGASPELERPSPLVGAGVQNGESRLKVHLVTVEPVAMRFGKPGQGSRGDGSWSLLENSLVHKFDINLIFPSGSGT